MALVLITLWVTNLLDCLFTRAAFARGAGEGNPLMALFMNELGVSGTFVFKLAWVTIGCIVLWRYRRLPGMYRMTVACTLVYVALVLYEAVALWA